MADKSPVATLPIDELGHGIGILANADPNEPVGQVMSRLAAGPPKITPADLPVAAAGGGSNLLAGLPSAATAPTAYQGPSSAPPPGLFGRIGHGLETVGKDVAIGAGSEFAPRVMPWIAGTPQYERRLQMEQREGQLIGAKTGLESAQAGLTGAEAEKTRQLTPAQYALMGAQTGEAGARSGLYGAQTQMMEEALKAYESPDVQKAFQVIGDPNAPIEDRRNAMAMLSQRLGPFSALRGELSGAQGIYREGETGSRIGPQNVFPDPASPTGYSRQMLSHDGTHYVSTPTVPPAGLVSKENQTFRTVTDAAGNEYLVPITTVSSPVLSGGTPKASAGSVPAVPGQTTPGGATPAGHKQLSQSARTQIGAIDTTLATLDQLRQQVEPIVQQHDSGQLSDVAAKNALWLAYKSGFANSLSDMQAGVSLTRILGSLAYMKGTRAYQWINDIQQHLPRPNDSYPLMLEKIQVAQRMLPWVKYGTLVTEGLLPGNADKLGFDKKTNGYVAHYKDGSIRPIPF